jgi:uncharacterized protein YndB with AHSA1/START domain
MLMGSAALAQDKVPSWRDYPAVSNSSFVEPSGDRALQLSIVVPAPARAVFEAFTTEKGFAAWAVPVARVDFRVGGEIESSYDAKAKWGDPDNIRNRIDAYVPDRLLVIHNVQAPAALPGREAFGKTVTILQFEPVDANRTRVTLTNAGYGKGADYDAIYRHFEWGNAYTLDELRKHFEKRVASR